jgi:hypothetical protein
MLSVAVAAYARYGFDASWYAAVSLAAIVYLLPPFILSRVWAKMHGDALTAIPGRKNCVTLSSKRSVHAREGLQAAQLVMQDARNDQLFRPVKF